MADLDCGVGFRVGGEVRGTRFWVRERGGRVCLCTVAYKAKSKSVHNDV